MNANALLKSGANIITFLVIIAFFLFSIFIPFNQIFPNSETLNIHSFSWFISLIFLVDILFKVSLLTNKMIKNKFLEENDFANYLKTNFVFDFIAVIPITFFPNPSLCNYFH